MADAPHTSDPSPTGRPGNTAAGHDPPNEYLKDFISGRRIRATPEQTQAVQVFARRLVEDYGYGKSKSKPNRSIVCGRGRLTPAVPSRWTSRCSRAPAAPKPISS